jgi:hypothetical protein
MATSFAAPFNILYTWGTQEVLAPTSREDCIAIDMHDVRGSYLFPILKVRMSKYLPLELALLDFRSSIGAISST